jgi:hypothetical protein
MKKARKLGKRGDEMDDDDMEFLKAVDKWRREIRRCPTVTDYLQIAKALGYRKDGHNGKQPKSDQPDQSDRPDDCGKSGRQKLRHRRLRTAGVGHIT